MIPSVQIWSISFPRLLAISILMVGTFGCEVKEEPVKKIYKARPENKLPAPARDEKPVRETPKIDSLKMPIDSMQKNLKDTTETLHQNEKKQEIKINKKRYYYFSIYKKPLIT